MKLTTLALGTALLTGGAAAVAATGEEIYQRQCAACHGATGAGDGPQAGQGGIARPRAFSESAKERMTIEKAILSGVSNAPGHGNAPLFTSDEVRALIDHVHKLAKP